MYTKIVVEQGLGSILHRFDKLCEGQCYIRDTSWYHEEGVACQNKIVTRTICASCFIDILRWTVADYQRSIPDTWII